MGKTEKFSLVTAFFILFARTCFADVGVKDIETSILRQDFDQAKAMATQMLENGQAGSRESEVRYYSGLSDLRLGNFNDARMAFSGLIGSKVKGPLKDKAFLGLFDSYYLEGDYKQARQTISQLLKESPRSEFLSLIYLKLARAHLRLAHWDEARLYLKKITDEFPESLEIHVAKQLLNEKQYFAVQIGAFLDRHLAEQLVNELNKKGEYAYIVETVDRENRTFYRVRVGQLVRLDKAQKLEQKLSNDGYPTQIYP